MNNYMLGKVFAVKNDDVVLNFVTEIQVTERTNTDVEICVELNVRGCDRVFVEFSLSDLVRIAMQMSGPA